MGGARDRGAGLAGGRRGLAPVHFQRLQVPEPNESASDNVVRYSRSHVSVRHGRGKCRTWHIATA
eukprot:2252483-Rhodomonas_salina.2